MCIKYFLHKLDLHAEQLNVITEVRTLVSERVVNLPGFSLLAGTWNHPKNVLNLKASQLNKAFLHFFAKFLAYLIIFKISKRLCRAVGVASSTLKNHEILNNGKK